MKYADNYAHYFKSKKENYILITKTTSPRNPTSKIIVANKTEARKVAEDNNAMPWNF